MNPTPPIPKPVGDSPAPPGVVADDTPNPNPKLWLVPLLVLVLVQVVPPFVPVSNRWVALVGIVLLTLLYVGGVVAFSLGMARQKLRPATLLLGFVGSALLFGLVALALQKVRFGYVAQSFALLGLGTFGGLGLSRMIRYPNMIGPIGVMVALIDIWGVLFGGIVAQLLTNKATAPIAQNAMASGPKLGAPGSLFRLSLPDIGIGDYLFLALFLGALVRFGMNWNASARWMAGFVALALLLIILVPAIPALPGLLFLGAGTVLPNLRYFQFTREERFALLYAGVFVLLLSVALYFGLTSMLPKH